MKTDIPAYARGDFAWDISVEAQGIADEYLKKVPIAPRENKFTKCISEYIEKATGPLEEAIKYIEEAITYMKEARLIYTMGLNSESIATEKQRLHNSIRDVDKELHKLNNEKQRFTTAATFPNYTATLPAYRGPAPGPSGYRSRTSSPDERRVLDPQNPLYPLIINKGRGPDYDWRGD